MRFIRIICTIAFVGALSGQNGQPMRALTRDVAEEYPRTLPGNSRCTQRIASAVNDRIGIEPKP
jgi:hypothetical protein